jgi:Tfp pilus assembly protein PilW
VNRCSRRKPSGQRGFTLVELMVALSGGLFLSVMVFALARDTTRFYQREGRLASATLAGIVGFDRLKADIARAGYLSTPNVQRDPRVGSLPGAGAPIGLQTLAGVRITPDTPNLSSNPAFALNAGSGQTLTPDEIVLSGSYTVTDEFPVADASNGQNIFLQLNSPSMARLGYIGASTAAQTALLQNVFGTGGRLLRIVDQSGQQHYGQITNVTAGNTPSVTLATAVTVRSGSAGPSGLRGLEVGASANVVNRIRYRVMDLRTDSFEAARWAPVFSSSSGAPGEDSRTELIREELDAANSIVANSRDLVAEYAVDLDFAVTGQLVANTPSVTTAAPGSAGFVTFFQAGALGRPQGVRSVRVRLSVRSREGDREANIPGGGLFRFQIGPAQWARVRTFQADVALPNQANVQW